MEKWYVECEAVERQALSLINTGAMVVYVACNESREEVSRVGFAREHTNNPGVSFAKQIDREIGKAEKSAKILNKRARKAGVLL